LDTSDDDIRQLRRSIAEPAAFRAVFERHHPALRRYRVGVGRGTVRGRWVALRGQGTEGGRPHAGDRAPGRAFAPPS